MRFRLFAILLIFLFSSGIAASKKDVIKVKKVVFEGNSEISSQTLLKVILMKPSRLFNPVVFQEAILLDDLDALGTYYNRQGFLNAEILDPVITIDSTKSKVDISIPIEEGARARIEDLSFLGNDTYSDSTLLRVSALEPGKPLIAAQIEKATLKLLRFYADRGYLEASVKPASRLNDVKDKAFVDIVIVEHSQYTIGAVEIDGNDKTKSNVIHRELDFTTEEIANYSRILSSQKNLYLTGLFERVYLQPIPNTSDSTLRDIHIELKEVQAGELNFSAGYGSIDRFRVKVQFYQANLRGTAMKIGLSTQLSSIQRGIEAQFTNPRIRGSRWRLDVTQGLEKHFQPSFDLNRIASKVALQKKLDRRLSITLSQRNELNTLSNVLVDTLDGALAADVHSLRGRLTWDTRDNLFNPTSGILIDWLNEIAGGPVSSSNAFFKSNLRVTYQMHTFKNSVLASSLEVGSVSSYGGNYRISLQERFYAGGPNSLRGFAYQSVGPLDASNNPQGGFVQIIWNVVELRVPVYKSLQAACFVDAGNVWRDYTEISGSKLRQDIGLGLHYITPIGVIRLETAFPINDEVTDPRVFFSMGYGF